MPRFCLPRDSLGGSGAGGPHTSDPARVWPHSGSAETETDRAADFLPLTFYLISPPRAMSFAPGTAAVPVTLTAARRASSYGNCAFTLSSASTRSPTVH